MRVDFSSVSRLFPPEPEDLCLPATQCFVEGESQHPDGKDIMCQGRWPIRLVALER